MTKAITVRLDDDDHAALQRRAEEVGVRPGTLARILVHAGLRTDPRDEDSARVSAALERLVRRSGQWASDDAVALVSDARAGLDPER